MWETIQAGQGVELIFLGMGSVFFALTVLAVLMSLMGRWFTRDDKPTTEQVVDAAPQVVEDQDGIPDQVLAAIATALSLSRAAEEERNLKPGRRLTAWRLAGIRELPQRRGGPR